MAEDIYMLVQNKYIQLRREADEKCAKAIEELYTLHPALKELTDKVTAANGALIRSSLKGCLEAVAAELEAALNKAKAERESYIAQNNIDMSVFTVRYTCSDCNDTGRLPNGMRCQCFNDYYSEYKFGAADMKILKKENFDTFDVNVFPELTKSGVNQREQMAHLKNALMSYCEKFPEQQKKNIIVSGLTGTGKSFIINCITKALSDRRFAVVKLNAYKMINDLFDLYISDSTEFNAELERLSTVDVLIIDDLGTELVKENFTLNTIYYILDKRLELDKAVIVATNLSVQLLEDKYSDRIMSRLFNRSIANTVLLNGDDVRTKLK